MKLRRFKSKKFLLTGFVLIILCGSIMGIYSFRLLNTLKGMNLRTATHVSQEFVQNIHNGNTALAYAMLSEEFRPPISQDQFSDLVQQDQIIFSTYEKLEVCDWGIFIDNGYVINVTGLIYFQYRAVVFQMSLHKDSDAVWRIQGFRFRSDIEPAPFGLCQ